MDNLKYEIELLNRGIKYIAGVDEAGRGPLAGPLVAAAVILDIEKLLNNDVISGEKNFYSQITDSKKIPEKKRTELSKFIKEVAISYSVIEISHTEIDNLGIGNVNKTAFYTAITTLNISPDHIITDCFNIKEIEKSMQTNLIGGDFKSITVGAASIIAKVYRDGLMVEFSNKYPIYGFEKHKGYGTKQHLQAIEKWGPCEIHRKSFDPIKSLFKS